MERLSSIDPLIIKINDTKANNCRLFHSNINIIEIGVKKYGRYFRNKKFCNWFV